MNRTEIQLHCLTGLPEALVSLNFTLFTSVAKIRPMTPSQQVQELQSYHHSTDPPGDATSPRRREGCEERSFAPHHTSIKMSHLRICRVNRT